MPGDTIFEQMRLGMRNEGEAAFQTLFPTKDKFRLQQMLTEVSIRAIMPWSVLGVFRRKYKSKTLSILQEEHNINKVALDRKGRIEATEIVAAVRRQSEEKEND